MILFLALALVNTQVSLATFKPARAHTEHWKHGEFRCSPVARQGAFSLQRCLQETLRAEVTQQSAPRRAILWSSDLHWTHQRLFGA